MNDVSDRHYDRYDYLPEKRAAMAKWGAALQLSIDGKPESNILPFAKSA
ncbi:hypothetical protein [Methylotuvimicrobium sp. KM2]